MKNNKWACILFIFICIIIGTIMFFKKSKSNKNPNNNYEAIKLAAPLLDGKISIEKAINQRRSIREYSNSPLTIQEITQLLWAAQGITNKQKELRAAPSAGALYPLEIYLVAGNVSDLPAGIYKYKQNSHELIKLLDGDKKSKLCNAALSQSCVKNAPAVIVICAIFERITRKYGDRGHQYVHMEVGAVAENIYLQATTLNLGTVFIGAFDDNEVQKILNAPKDEIPLCIMPIGKK